jgi:hypothetical protein
VTSRSGLGLNSIILELAPEHRGGHGRLYAGLNHGRIDVARLRVALSALPLPRAAGGRIVVAVDVSPWLRSDAPTSAQRLFCHVHGRAKIESQFIPGWPYSFVAAVAMSWDRLHPGSPTVPPGSTTKVSCRSWRER